MTYSAEYFTRGERNTPVDPGAASLTKPAVATHTARHFISPRTCVAENGCGGSACAWKSFVYYQMRAHAILLNLLVCRGINVRLIVRLDYDLVRITKSL